MSAPVFRRIAFGHGTRGCIQLDGEGRGFKWGLDIPSWDKASIYFPVGPITGAPNTGNLTGCYFMAGLSYGAGTQYRAGQANVGDHVIGMSLGGSPSAATLTGVPEATSTPTPNSNVKWTGTIWNTHGASGSFTNGSGTSNFAIPNYDQQWPSPATRSPSQGGIIMTISKNGGTSWTMYLSTKIKADQDDPEAAMFHAMHTRGQTSTLHSQWRNTLLPYHDRESDPGETGAYYSSTSAFSPTVDEGTDGAFDSIFAYWECTGTPAASLFVGTPVVKVLSRS